MVIDLTEAMPIPTILGAQVVIITSVLQEEETPPAKVTTILITQGKIDTIRQLATKIQLITIDTM